MLIDNVKSPEDIKGFNKEQLEKLAEEIRKGLMNRLSKKGGHFGPNFGFVEATIALHYVFNSPVDKFVFDVSHQSYVHKMLTGKKTHIFMMSILRMCQVIPILKKVNTIFSMWDILPHQSVLPAALQRDGT